MNPQLLKLLAMMGQAKPAMAASSQVQQAGSNYGVPTASGMYTAGGDADLALPAAPPRGAGGIGRTPAPAGYGSPLDLLIRMFRGGATTPASAPAPGPTVNAYAQGYRDYSGAYPGGQAQ